MTWNPDQYLKFAAPRLRPAIELLARVALDAPGRVCDLGCGTGSITKLLAERWPQAHITAVDGDAAMLARAGDAPSSIDWVQAELATWTSRAPLDLIYSNAALHWLPDHARLFPRLMAMLGGGGVLAVQMPRNFTAPSHTAIEEAVRSGPWRTRLEGLLRQAPVAEPAWYFDALAPLASELDIWETEYQQVLTGADPVKEWTKGTWLGPFLEALEGDQREAFEADYAARVRSAYPQRSDGRTLFPFKRLFIVARR